MILRIIRRIAECDRILGAYKEPGSCIKAGLAANVSPATAAPKSCETGLFACISSRLALLLLMHEVQMGLMPANLRTAWLQIFSG